MTIQTSILLIDDEPGNREALCLLLRRAGHRVTSAATGEEALRLLSRENFDVIITDLFLPGISGIDILKRVREEGKSTNVILITGNATAETAVEAMKEGAFDYITKPINFDKLSVILAKAIDKSRLVAENLYLREQLRGKFRFSNIIGNSLAMQQVFRRMEKIVLTDSTILILGESGTGKEVVAKAIHYNGPRKDKPFIAINCGAIPAELLESELFGHVRGSFTGAVSDKAGKFESANGGTVFLDEIGTMPIHLQMKLLRVLQEHEVEKVGSSKKIELNVRVISATNANLEEEVARGNFREDLYYRLNVIPILLPPLRERQEDILLLARHFLKETCDAMKRPLMGLSSEAARAMEAYNWPGNVREMENVIERAVTLSESKEVELQDLPPAIATALGKHRGQPFKTLQLSPEGIDLPRAISDIERQAIRDALTLAEGVKARAASLLGLNRTTLVEKIRRLGIGDR